MENKVSFQAIPGIKLFTKISETANSIVFRGRREQTQQNVIVKSYKYANLNHFDITQSQNEYELMKSLNHPGITG